MSKSPRDTGWGVRLGLRDAHYWIADKSGLKLKTICKFAIARVFDVYDARPNDERCAECVAALAAAPKVNK